jgi:hypothetical protein
VFNAFKNGTEKLPITGFIPGQLTHDILQASANVNGINELSRKLYGSCTFNDEGKASISDEVNGKRDLAQSALITAGTKIRQKCRKFFRKTINLWHGIGDQKS